MLKKRDAVTHNPSIMVYVNKLENKITFKIKAGYYLDILTPETMKFLGTTKSKITVAVLIHSNIANNGYQQDSGVLYKIVPNKSFGQSLDILPKNFIFFKTFNSEFPYSEVWLSDQSFNPR